MEINELQELARNGEREAEEELFRRLSARFTLFARHRLRDRAQAEEVVQDALQTVYEKYKSIDFESSFSAWAYQVLKNKIMTRGTTESRRQGKLDEMSERETGTAPVGPPRQLERSLLNCLQELNRSKGRHARIVNLHYQGYSVQEICRRLNLKTSNFYTILSRARAILQACLEKEEVL